MIRLASVIDTFEADFRTQYHDRLTPEHLQALAAMQHCRTHASPKMQVRCTGCEHQILVPHSCGLATVRIASITRASNGWNGKCSGWCRPSTF
jgi:hypothetical protein